ncbi:MAG: Fis family transcriptional regulator [Demequinaceae bacterium]|nr:Fis family transcriptional regulator [Demequinaceae bacterium]
MDRANSGLTWINQPHVVAFLRELVASPNLSHNHVDRLPESRTREYVRGLLVEHGALPRRDERLELFKRWSETAVLRLPEGPQRDAITQYIRWHLLRRMNAMEAVSESAFLRSKQTVTVAIDFLVWLAFERNSSLGEACQADVDEWQAGGSSTRQIVERFLGWAKRARLVSVDLKVYPHRRGTARRLSVQEQQEVISTVLHPRAVSPRDRLAAVFVIILGQRIEHVARLRWDAVVITEEAVTVKLGTERLRLPAPLDEPLRELADQARRCNTAAHPSTAWVFRGANPGAHINSAYLRGRLRGLFPVRAARLGTLEELVKTTPVPILAEALGYHPATIEQFAHNGGATFGGYVAARLEDLGTEPPREEGASSTDAEVQAAHRFGRRSAN